MKNRADNIQGFTLVEMALVLVVVGIVIGIGAGMIGPLMSMSKNRETKEFIGSAVESVNSWAASNNRLPDVTAGTTGFRSVVKTPTDAWGRDLIYLYDSNFIAASKDTICGRKTTLITLRQCLTANCATTPGTDYIDMSNVAYVVFSQGDDATIQTASTDAAVAISRQFTPGVAVRVTLDMNHNDIVRWVTLDELRSKIGCQGAQLKIVNNELPYGSISAQYNANIFADGGVPYAAGGKYRWCIENAAGVVPSNLTFSTGGTNIPFRTVNGCKTLTTEATWVQSDSIAIAIAPTTVTGTDAKIYTCIQQHVAAAINQPVTGANWASFWVQSGAAGAAWTAGTTYTAPPSTNSFTIFVRDSNDTSAPPALPATDNDNFSSKAFVLTVNP